MSAVELACSKCQGRLLVEQFGIVVACPHCGAHLSIPKEMDPNAAPPVATPVATTPEPTDSSTTISATVTSEAPASTGSSIIVKSSPELEKSDSSDEGDLPEFMRPPNAEAVDEIPDFSAPPASEDIPEINTSPATTPPPTTTEPPAVEPVTNAEPATAPSAESTGDAPDFSGLGGDVSHETPDFGALAHQDDESPTFPSIDINTTPEATPAAPVVPSVSTPTPAETPATEEKTEAVAEAVKPAETPAAATTIGPPSGAEVSDGPDFSGFGQSDDDMPTFPSFDAPAVAEPQPVAPVVESATTTAPAVAPTASKTSPEPLPKDDTVAIRKRRASTKSLPNLAFQVWLSYTIVVTFIAGLLWFRSNNSQPHQLESLPDVRPKMDDQGEVSVRIAPENATMPPAHTLKIGETQRFGNVEVTPMRVTRGPIQFVHHATKQPKNETDGPVLKLWLKFKNVSDDQVIDPLDSKLVFTRGHIASDRDGWHANNFLATPEQKTNDVTGDVLLVYDHIVVGDWDLKGQELGKKLKPGESLETFIPSGTDGLGKLKGDLLWRVHFRKGFSPAGYGVTTLVEVQFDSDAIDSDA